MLLCPYLPLVAERLPGMPSGVVMVDQLADALRPYRQICHLEQEPPLQLSPAQLDCSSAAVRTEHHLGRLDGFLIAR